MSRRFWPTASPAPERTASIADFNDSPFVALLKRENEHVAKNVATYATRFPPRRAGARATPSSTPDSFYQIVQGLSRNEFSVEIDVSRVEAAEDETYDWVLHAKVTPKGKLPPKVMARINTYNQIIRFELDVIREEHQVIFSSEKLPDLSMAGQVQCGKFMRSIREKYAVGGENVLR